MYQSIAAFTLAASLLTITPGLDTAMVLRTAAVDGPRRATLAAAGILIGLLVWGGLVSVGLGVLLLGSALLFAALKTVGAAYLVYLGIRMLFHPRDGVDAPAAPRSAAGTRGWLLRGLLTNMLNPKVGLFYVSFLPQFIPQGVNAGLFSFGLAAIHAALGVLWFAVLIVATTPIARAMRQPSIVRWLDRATGALFVAFGVRLAWTTRS